MEMAQIGGHHNAMSKFFNVANLEVKIVAASLFGIVAFFVLRMIAPVGVDTVFLGDTLFLTNLGWRGVNGYLPHFDYEHFYGGATERMITIGFQLFGVDFKSVDYVHGMVFVAVSAFVLLVTARRISGTSLSIVLLLAAFVILSANDIEDGFTTWASHSFLYNHTAIGLLMGLIVFFAVRADAGRGLQIAAALVAGGGLYWVTLLKTPFAVFIIAALLALVLQKRWSDLVLVALGLAITILIVDPGFFRALSAADILFSSKAFDDSGGLVGRIERMFKTVLWHLPYLAILLLLVVGYLQTEGRVALNLLLTLMILLAGYGAVTLVMAGEPDQIMIPALVASLGVLSDRLTAVDHKMRKLSYSATFLIALAIAVPGLATSAQTAVRGILHGDEVLIEDGPMASYLLFDTNSPMEFLTEPTAEARRTAAVQQTLPRLKEEEHRSIDGYIRLADGWALLKDIPNIRTFGIISSRDSLDFTFALRSRPVLSFPVWATPNSVNWLDLEDVDIILEARFPQDVRKFNDEMQARVDATFRECRSSELYRMKTRVGDDRIACD